MFSSWQLLVGLFVVWMLWAIAAMMERAAEDVRKGIPKEQRGHVSIVPVIPLFPLFFWGVACLLDLFVSHLGTVLVSGGHVVLSVCLIVSIIRDWKRLRSKDKQI